MDHVEKNSSVYSINGGLNSGDCIELCVIPFENHVGLKLLSQAKYDALTKPTLLDLKLTDDGKWACTLDDSSDGRGRYISGNYKSKLVRERSLMLLICNSDQQLIAWVNKEKLFALQFREKPITDFSLEGKMDIQSIEYKDMEDIRMSDMNANEPSTYINLDVPNAANNQSRLSNSSLNYAGDSREIDTIRPISTSNVNYQPGNRDEGYRKLDNENRSNYSIYSASNDYNNNNNNNNYNNNDDDYNRNKDYRLSGTDIRDPTYNSDRGYDKVSTNNQYAYNGNLRNQYPNDDLSLNRTQTYPDKTNYKSDIDYVDPYSTTKTKSNRPPGYSIIDSNRETDFLKHKLGLLTAVNPKFKFKKPNNLYHPKFKLF